MDPVFSYRKPKHEKNIGKWQNNRKGRYGKVGIMKK